MYHHDTHEENLVRQTLTKENLPELPDYVLDFHYRFGSDSTGDPAVWTWLEVIEEAMKKSNLGDDIFFIMLYLHDRLQEAGVTTLWPYISFVGHTEVADRFTPPMERGGQNGVS